MAIVITTGAATAVRASQVTLHGSVTDCRRRKVDA